MGKKLLLVLAAATLALHADAGAVVLTEKNFVELTEHSGKGAFVKFFAPWCGHCKEIKPTWDKLANELNDSETVIIGDVDCTAFESKKICSKMGVKGYPTLKYFNGEWEDYRGDREFDALKSFAESVIGPGCSPKSLEACNTEQRAFLDEWTAKSAAEVEAKIKEMETEIEKITNDHEEHVKALQKQFKESKEKLEGAVNAIKPGPSRHLPTRPRSCDAGH